MKKLQKTRPERVEIVNQLITFIASNGRQLFRTRSTGDVAYMMLKKGRVHFVDDYTKAEIEIRHGSREWDGFSHGGTMRALVLDFTDFIRTGEDSNGRNGYGGLYSSHWGNSKEVQERIIAYAKEIGYLRG